MGCTVRLCILIFAAVTAIYDTWWEPQKAQKAKDRSAPEPDVPTAAQYYNEISLLELRPTLANARFGQVDAV